MAFSVFAPGRFPSRCFVLRSGFGLALRQGAAVVAAFRRADRRPECRWPRWPRETRAPRKCKPVFARQCDRFTCAQETQHVVFLRSAGRAYTFSHNWCRTGRLHGVASTPTRRPHLLCFRCARLKLSVRKGGVLIASAMRCRRFSLGTPHESRASSFTVLDALSAPRGNE